MTLRTKLLLGYAGFVLALGVLGAWSARTLNQMSAVSGRIIAENYDSVVAAQDMKESLERVDSAALFELQGQHDRATAQATEHRMRFNAAFAKAAANITEPGEREVVEAIGIGRDAYFRRFDDFLPASGDRTARYFGVLEPLFNAVRADCDRLLHLNQEAMRRKADLASAIARRWFYITLGLALLLMVVGVAVEFSLSNAIVGPVRQLTDATTKVAAGDLDTAVPVHSSDEIGTLAVGFNQMAGRIRELRRSDLGKLLIAQQTTDAAIDSLYDPVIVTDGDGLVTRINPAAERLFGGRVDTVGKRIEHVAPGPRIAQAVSDVLLGWQRATRDGVSTDYYVRQLQDWKGSLEVEGIPASVLERYARICAETLARAHARSGDRIAIAAYLGGGDAFDHAVGEFAAAYADKAEADHAALRQAVADGRIKAEYDV